MEGKGAAMSEACVKIENGRHYLDLGAAKTNVQIKRCPFCGSNNTKIGESYRQHKVDGPMYREYRVCCKDCWASAGYQNSESAAVNAWNQRAVSNLFDDLI